MTSPHTTACRRARALVSQGLDVPLHDLEERLVAKHLSDCDICRTFMEDVGAFTERLRSAPHEQLRWPIAVEAARRRMRVRAIAQVASAAAVLVVAGSLSLGSERPWRAAEAAKVGAARADPVGEEQAIRVLRREALSDGSLQILPVAIASPATPSAAQGKPALDSTIP